MGAWGTGIFQDDTACDIRDQYKDLLGEGLSPQLAKARILESYASSFADQDESGVAWLALAAVQSKTGRLDADTLGHALRVIDSGSDLLRWSGNPKDLAKRKIALNGLRVQLTAPQPPEKKVAKRILCECRWHVGDLFSFQLLSGRLIVFRVIGHHTDKGGTYPVCELLDWIGSVIPSESELSGLEVKRSRKDFKHTVTQMMLVGLKRKWATRVADIPLKLKPTQKRERCSVVHFKFLDKFLREWFLLE
jgi:hypothetical protein